jgi:hypothetical protein
MLVIINKMIIIVDNIRHLNILNKIILYEKKRNKRNLL